LLSGKFSLYCPNDNLVNVDEEEYEKSKKVVVDAFDKILPKKSEFEI